MLKKVILGVLMVGLVGVLIVGAINRTNAKSAQVAGVQEQGSGGQGQSQGKGQGKGGGQGYASAVIPGDQTGAGSVTAADWLTLEGTVVSVSADEMVVETAGGAQIIVEGRPWDFAQETGFVVQTGDAVTLTGFYEDGEFKAGQITGAGGQSAPLRDETGRPGWAGRGRRAGSGGL
ncbi:MAG: hypothetical protein JXB47_11725 [Anaerolineae bacterium]|nr:hypothetical protein [Anaerolineae bacterium]